MKVIDIIGVTDMLAQLVERTKQSHPQTSENIARRNQHYARQAAAARSARRHLDALKVRCAGPLCARQVDEVRFRAAGADFCSRNCMEGYYSRLHGQK